LAPFLDEIFPVDAYSQKDFDLIKFWNFWETVFGFSIFSDGVFGIIFWGRGDGELSGLKLLMDFRDWFLKMEVFVSSINSP